MHPNDSLFHDFFVFVPQRPYNLLKLERQFDSLWSSAGADHVPDIETILAKRSFEETSIGLHENPWVLQGSIQDELALRRLMLEEKALLVEMQLLGPFTKEEFMSRLAQIEARYKEVATRPTPAKRPRLFNLNNT
ncbi:hypothetical protein B0H14DRAFT_3506003 [Mycena olivaceomarginata]|nr:hypothetical protein B0H14DRAFT_3506003 [Mycena olivaceomarginata]